MLWENEILAKFSFLKKYGFGFEFLTLKKDDIVTFNTFVALIYKVNIYFVIKIYINYSFEPICFYKLNGKNEINDIFLYNTNKEIEVYNRDLDLWKRVYKKNKFLRQSDVFTVVSESIKRQIETNKSFYGIPID